MSLSKVAHQATPSAKPKVDGKEPNKDAHLQEENDIFSQIKLFADNAFGFGGDIPTEPGPPPKQSKPWYKDKQHSWDLLYSTPDYVYERRYPQWEAETRLKNALFDMTEFDFMVSTAKIPPDAPKKSIKRCIRAVHLAFVCKNCKPTNKFTSHCGTIVVAFQIKRMAEWVKTMKHPFLVTFNVRIYNMQCAKCMTMCTANIFDSHLEAVEIQFANIISQIIAGVKVKKGKKTRFRADIRGHKRELCEACSAGVCRSSRGGIPPNYDEGD
jgi:hypothetical protein